MRKTHKIRPKGLTILELMIALLISTFLIAAVIQVYLSMVSSYSVQANVARLQEDARFIVDTITHELRMSDYAGCRAAGASKKDGVTKEIAQSFFLNDALPWRKTTGTGNLKTLRGFKCTSTASSSCGYSGNANPLSTLSPTFTTAAGLDALIVRRMSEYNVRLSTFLPVAIVGNPPKYNLTMSSTFQGTATPIDFVADDIVVVADCEKMAIGKISSISSLTATIIPEGTTFNPLLLFTPNNAVIGRLATTLFYVNANGELVRRTMNKNVFTNDSVISGESIVTGFTIRYGVDTDATKDDVPNQFLRADAITDANWENVVAARIDFVLSAGTSSAHTVGRQFSTTINMRNQRSQQK